MSGSVEQVASIAETAHLGHPHSLRVLAVHALARPLRSGAPAFPDEQGSRFWASSGASTSREPDDSHPDREGLSPSITAAVPMSVPAQPRPRLARAPARQASSQQHPSGLSWWRGNGASSRARGGLTFGKRPVAGSSTSRIRENGHPLPPNLPPNSVARGGIGRDRASGRCPESGGNSDEMGPGGMARDED